MEKRKRIVMGINELPEKVYIHKSQYWGLMANVENITENGIEYTRTDTFIEKACGFIKEHLFFEDSWYVEGETSILDKVIEDFRNYMKGE